ncbi:aminotransferase class I/II-fold pyridoxal phosphate-dependent enzyme [Bradyrhizobium sp. NP1]|uniref:DegT/DnrJ/EryC1/StrS family aminotransferase n=1 Tax=Bradyrhizobium sp. NP1 TaxID=3049772 RepID=UPI0025A62354|nr:aminotransferase class I/II-fold pyridoxal phosphate-dependent enzyme [Bradyrhizobium sp. NP1]WJR81419.1 aminotransferase class I/II-fold pyridoxal phosphate-dependent enzyme [Bradyrhizobium sp. NP1]
MPRVGFREMLALGRVIASGTLSRYESGSASLTSRFEARFAERLQAKHLLTVNSGTSALISALAAAGIGPGDEVLVPAYTWVSTAIAPLAVGAVPVLVDIDESLTIDPQDIERKITPYTKAIIPVHMKNLVCDMDAISAIAKRHRLYVIEDACQAVGVRYKDRFVGTIGDVGIFSFNYHKNLNAGEGGAVITNDDRLFTRARMYHDVGSYIRQHEFEGNEPIFSGVNFRVSELTGAVLLAQLSRLDTLLRRLRSRREMMVKHLSKGKKMKVSPHHDPTNAVGLSVIFERAEDAKKFAAQRGVERLIETGRHIYTNWEPIFAQRSFNPRIDPYKWAHREITYSAEMCSRTLDILERTCYVSLGPQYPAPVIWMQARTLARSLSS